MLKNFFNNQNEESLKIENLTLSDNLYTLNKLVIRFSGMD